MFSLEFIVFCISGLTSQLQLAIIENVIGFRFPGIRFTAVSIRKKQGGIGNWKHWKHFWKKSMKAKSFRRDLHRPPNPTRSLNSSRVRAATPPWKSLLPMWKQKKAARWNWATRIFYNIKICIWGNCVFSFDMKRGSYLRIRLIKQARLVWHFYRRLADRVCF